MNNLDTLLYNFLVEENNMSINEFQLLSEDFKTDTIKELASSVLTNINSKINSIEVLPIDKSRGEIKNFADLSSIQDTVVKLTNMAQNELDHVNPLLPKYLKEIVNSIYNLNKYSTQFKNAYRAKQTFLILRYQSIILSVATALSYLISVSIDFKDANVLKLKDKISIEEISPIKCLIDFNKSVEDGTFDNAVKDTTSLREFYVEYTVKELSTIYEAIDIVSLINNGISAFTHNLVSDRNRNGLVLKFLGVVTVILSLRDTFYTLYNSKFKFGEALQNIKTFLNIKNLPSVSALSRFITFNNKNVIDAETATQKTIQQISQENKDVVNKARSIPSEFDSTTEFMPSQVAEPESTDNTTDVFSQFNF